MINILIEHIVYLVNLFYEDQRAEELTTNNLKTIGVLYTMPQMLITEN